MAIHSYKRVWGTEQGILLLQTQVRLYQPGTGGWMDIGMQVMVLVIYTPNNQWLCGSFQDLNDRMYIRHPLQLASSVG